MMKRKYTFGWAAFGTAILVVPAVLFLLTACGNPSGGDGPPSGNPPIPVSDTVDPDVLEDLGLEAGGSARIEFRDSGGQVVAAGTIESGGNWAVEIPDEYAGSNLTMVLVISNTDNTERVFYCGTAAIDAENTAAIQPNIPDTANEYDIVLTSVTNGSCEVSRENDVFAGEIITITAAPSADYRLKQPPAVTKNGGGDITPSQTGPTTWTFIVPGDDVTLTVEFELIPIMVSELSLDDKVIAPVRDATPDTTAIATSQYTGTVAWKTQVGAGHSGPFAASTVYKAVVSLTAETGYTFEGVLANSFTYTGATSITNAVNSGVVTITFPQTDPDATVSELSLDGKVIAPARGATPDTTAFATSQYTGAVAWKTQAGADHLGPFAASTVYKAVVSLTAKTGYTFEGVLADSFTYTGASASNAENSGVVTITFPQTEPDPNTEIPIGNASVKLYLDDESTPLAHNGTTDIALGTGIFTVSIDSGTYTSIVWYLNGTEVAGGSGKTSISLSNKTAKTFLVMVEAQPSGGTKNSGIHTFVVVQ
jgi:hypothetical protein